MFKRPIVGIAICMGVGIFVGYASGMPLKFAYIGFFVFAIASAVAWIFEKRAEKGATFIFICVAVFFLGITLMQGERQNLLAQARALGLEFPGGQDRIDAKEGNSEAKKWNSGSEWRGSERARRFQYLTIRGTICAFPEERTITPVQPGGEEEDEIAAVSEDNAVSDKASEASARISNEMKKISFPLKIEEVKKKDKWEKMEGKILVNIYETDEKEIASACNTKQLVSHCNDKFKIGDRLEINGHLQPVPGPRNPGDFDYGSYLRRQGIVGQMSIRTKMENGVCPYFRILSRNNINFITRIAARGRDYMEKIIDLGPYDNGRDVLLKAMLIGKREGMDEGMKENFINTGTIHIMAISGLHLGIVMVIILFLCRIIFLPQRFASISCIAFLILYAFLTGGRASVWRATIMSALYLGSAFFNRQVDKWTTFSMAGLVILFISPQALFDSGFQLTFMAVAGLMYFYPRLEKTLRERFKGLFSRAMSRYLVKSILVILAAQIALGPFLIYYYYRIPLIAVIANLAVVPLLGIITILGFVSSLAGLISLPLAMAFNATNSIFLLIMDKAASFLSVLPGQVIYLPKLSPLFFLLYYGIFFLLFYPVRNKQAEPVAVSPGSRT